MKMSAMRILLVSSACLLAAGPALADVLAEIDDLGPGRLEVRGFELSEPEDVEVEAVGFEHEDSDGNWGHWNRNRMSGAWILDSATRDVVWSMENARSREDQDGLRRFAEEVSLEAGTYEVYYATYPDHDPGDDDDGLWSRLGRSLSRMGSDWKDYARALDEFRVTVRGRGRSVATPAIEDVRQRMADSALVAMTGKGDGEVESRGFELDQPMEVDVYAVGEIGEDGGYDYGWILDAESRERLWTFDHRRSEPGGGAEKNRVARATLDLPAGRYAAFFVTDDSHSPESWNALPPHDPAYWGLTVRVAEPDQRRMASTFDYRHFPGDEQVVVELARMRDDDYESKGFTISRPLDVRVYAVGEGSDDGMHDYGWIVDAKTREKVWSMDDVRDTEHAGGSQKNRVVDEVIRLEPGSYVVSFVTDGSHSYRDWNANPPTHRERWGVSLFAAGEDFDASWVSEYDEADDPDVLARIDRVRDGRRRDRTFSLDNASRVSIYAVGEGTHGEMYDYGWIEDARTGRVVWEMTYRKTDNAGGAEKNRLFQGDVMLEPGEYTVYFETDGSHSFGDWNASPPYDPEGWGIRVALAN